MYNVKNLEKVNTMIDWQVIRNTKASTLKINQFIFIRDLLKNKNLSDCNFVNISMKASNIIKMNNLDDYMETNIKVYQRIIEKLMYLSYGTRLDITFAVG